jgi:hypothetical protein
MWLAIRMQTKLEGTEWVRVRTHLRESLGFTNRAAHSRAMTELERAGFIEVERRRGYAPLVRLAPRRGAKLRDEWLAVRRGPFPGGNGCGRR